MHKLFIALVFFASVTTSLAAVAASSVEVHRYEGAVNEGSYIIKVRDGAQKSGVMNRISSFLGGSTKVTHNWDSRFFNGFAGNFGDNVIEALKSSIDVEYIAEDGIMKTFVDQNDAPWNLARVSTRIRLTEQDPFALNYLYRHSDNPGSGVDIYVVDTGVFVDHLDFGGRAKWGGAFCQGCANVDGNGHGTHVAGTAGGSRFGIAKTANLIAVKVLTDAGAGAISDIISGLEWVAVQHKASGRPSVATMSFGGSLSLPLNDAVKVLVAAGIHCTVAAGNSNVDAILTSPANVHEVITVGATDITDRRAFYSNYGPLVDVFAPGSNVTSTWMDGGYRTISGTSMATPNVAGLVAYFLPIIGTSTTPAAMSSHIRQVSTKNALGDIPILTVNDLAFNNFAG